MLIRSRDRNIAPRSGHKGKPSGDLHSAGYIFSREISSRMPTRQGILQSRRDFERRSTGRTTINRGVLMHFTGQDGVQACIVRNVTNQGAGLRLNDLNIVPTAFDISFDNFRTMRRCRLIRRDSDFVGAAFES
jgi:hypothetical protein